MPPRLISRMWRARSVRGLLTTEVVRAPTTVSARTQLTFSITAVAAPGRGEVMEEGAEPRPRQAGRPAADRDRQRSLVQ